MFSTPIDASEVAILSSAANKLYGNKINAVGFRGDSSFLATLRALLGDRMKDDEHIDVCRTPREARPVFSAYENAIIIKLLDESESPEITDECFVLKRDLGLLVEQSKLMKVCRVYINEDSRVCVIFCNTLNLKSWHAFQSLTPRLVPWFFRDKRLTDDEKRLLFALNTEIPDDYLKVLGEFANRIDFRGINIRDIVGGMVERIANQKILEIQRDLATAQEQLVRYTQQYCNCRRTMEDLNIRLNGYIVQRNAHESDDELLKFLNSQKWFEPIGATDYGFMFSVSSYLDQFDPDMYESISGNEYSFLWDIHRPAEFRDRNDFKLLMDAIFSCDATLKIKCYADFELDTRGSIDTDRNASSEKKFPDRVPNPHLYYHSCFGDHRPLIQDRIAAGDIIGAVMQCKQSASSINVGESATMRPFIENLLRTDKPCIHMPDGTDVTPAEALRILKEDQHA